MPAAVTDPIMRGESPPLFGEDYLSAQVLDIVCRYCNAGGDELDSYGVPAYAELMHMCAESGDIEITGEFGDRITGTVTPEGRATLEQFEAEESKSNEPPPRVADPDYTGWSDADLEAAWNEAHDRLRAIIKERADAHDLDMRHICTVRGDSLHFTGDAPEAGQVSHKLFPDPLAVA